MLRRLTTGALVALGLWLIALGVQRWLDHRQAASIVEQFLHALLEGNRDGVLAHLGPNLREELEARSATSAFRVPHPGVQHRIRRIEIAGDRAAAHLWIAREGFVLQPLVRLHRSPTGRWQVAGVENVRIDPLWLDLEAARSRLANEQLAEQLSEALKDRPDVSVERRGERDE
jgi:hypothetical protein